MKATEQGSAIGDEQVQRTMQTIQQLAQVEQFLMCQCKSHIHREPEQLGMNDLWNLAHWAMISGGLAIGKKRAEEMSDKIREQRKSMSSV